MNLNYEMEALKTFGMMAIHGLQRKHQKTSDAAVVGAKMLFSISHEV